MKFSPSTIYFRKDESLNRLADTVNVAQFVSFSPGNSQKQEYCRILGYKANHMFSSIHDALIALLNSSVDRSINIRSFLPNDPKSHEFIYGIRCIDKAMESVLRLGQADFFVIANETIDVSDGGVSGVLQGGVIEFSPDDTPRCVEKSGTASLSYKWGKNLIESIYGIDFPLKSSGCERIEFSIHPRACGWNNSHLIAWEYEETEFLELEPQNIWPNNFSKIVGDKAFGLLMADQANLPVPYTTVISRRIAPFSFGSPTGKSERWIRTCPTEQVPGKYTTHHGWLDPFELMSREDPQHVHIASVLSQHAVRSEYSGALIVDASGQPLIEGKKGDGEAFMLGAAKPEELPKDVVSDVLNLFGKAYENFGPIRFEWVHDGSKAWIVQLHRGATATLDKIIVPGEPEVWIKFESSAGLQALRKCLASLKSNEGLIIIGQVGLTSHVADILRKYNRPAKIF